MIDQAPHTFNPRMAQDAYSQRLGALFFRGLTRIGTTLEAEPDAAEAWSVTPDRLQWEFKIRPGLKDQKGQAILAADWVSCLEQYRVGKPTSLLARQLDSWIGTQLSGADRVLLKLSRPDPYLPKNISLFRFFRSAQGAHCQEPDSNLAGMVGSGEFFPESWVIRSVDDRVVLHPVSPDQKNVEVRIVRDDHRRILELLNDRVDAAQNSLPLGKSRWIQKNASDRFAFFEAPGVNVSYLAFNLSDPVLSRVEVRRAIAMAIDRNAIVQHKLFGFCTLANSLVSPELPEGNRELSFAFDPVLAEQILDQVGYRRGKNGIRFELSYRTTPQREGYETALLIREDLKKIGISVHLEVSEPAVYLAKIHQKRFQLYASRWIGVSDASILNRTLQSKNPFNRVGYANSQMDQQLERMTLASSEDERKKIADQIQKRMLEELPYFPLWYWNNALILRKSMSRGTNGDVFSDKKISKVGGIEPIVRWLSKSGAQP